MITVVRDVSFRACKDEQSFKMLYLKKCTPDFTGNYNFCIESEGTVLGFPDVIELTVLNNSTCAVLKEFKYGKTGTIHFQPTQPSFYRKYKDIKIKIIAFNAYTDRVHNFYASSLFDKSSPYYLNDNNKIDLTQVEIKMGLK